jgi:phosphonatase-like hydrolase
MSLELVVFDVAGTTVDDGDAVNRCLRETLVTAGLEVTRDQINGHMGLPKPVAIRALVEGTALAADVEALHNDFIGRMSAYYATDPAVGEVPCISRLFSALRAADIKVALNTGFSREIMDILLTRLGWVADELVDATVTSDEVASGRPSPDMIARLKVLLHVGNPGNVAKVGDTPADLEEGTNAHCGLVIGVTWGTHTRVQLRQAPHTHIVDTIEELASLLRLERNINSSARMN